MDYFYTRLDGSTPFPLRSVVDFTLQHRMAEWRWLERVCEGRGGSVSEVISRHLHGGNVGNNKNKMLGPNCQ
jgi:hypothetical protein